MRCPGNPQSIVVNSAGDILVSFNNADYIVVFDYLGVEKVKIAPSEYDEISSFRAAALAIDSNDNLYIGIKIIKSEIIKLDKDFNLILKFGEKGEANNQFSAISGLWIDSSGKIYVTDLFAIPVLKIFDSQGNYLNGFGGHTEEKMDFSFPAGIVTTKDGKIWIVDSIRQVVKCLNEEGDFLMMIGGFGYKPGDMAYPSSVATDGDSLIIVAEKSGNRFQSFIIK